MLRKFGYLAAASAFGGALALGTVAPASAAHCTSPEGDSPGFSYFGTDHVQEAEHAEGGNPGPHNGTSGASSCREDTGSPSERAPGRQ